MDIDTLLRIKQIYEKQVYLTNKNIISDHN
jgi:hypothetical protein